MSDDIVQAAIKLLEDWDTCYSQNEKMRDVALAALKSQSAEIERLKREAAIRIDALNREQEAHLRTIADYNRARVETEKLRERLAEADECNRRVSDENARLRQALYGEMDE